MDKNKRSHIFSNEKIKVNYEWQQPSYALSLQCQVHF